MTASAPIAAPSSAGWRPGELVSLLAITLLGGLVRLYGVREWSLGPLEVATWQALTLPSDGFFASDAARHPLVLWALRQAFDLGVLANGTEGWLRLPFVFAGALSVPLFALAARPWTSRGTTLFAAALFAVHPWHVTASQTASPPVVALALVLVALGAVRAGHRFRLTARAVTLLAAAAACASDRSGCLVVPMLLAGLAAARWQTAPAARRPLWAAATLGVVALPWLLQVLLGWPFAAGALDAGSGELLDPTVAQRPWWWVLWLARPVVVGLAVLGVWLWRPGRAAPFAALVVPLLGLALLAATGVDVVATDLLALLPLVVLLAAAAATTVAQRIGAFADGWAPRLAAFVVPIALSSLLVLDTTLRETVYEGHTSPWREVRDLALQARQPGRDLAVAAGEGAASLVYYLRPNHWRASARDPHPGVRVVPLTGDADLAVAAFAAADDDAVRLLVLRSGEYEALRDQALRDQAPRGEALRDAWELQRVLPCPREHGDGTLYLLRRREGGSGG